MQQHHKQRLIGAAVVIALAVIFLPMLLQGPVDRGTTDMAMDIPPRPQVEQGPDADDAAVRDESGAAAMPEDTDEPAAQLEAVPLPQGDTSNDTAPDVESGDGPPPEPDVMPEEDQQAPADVAEPSADEGDELASWAVQVGSFSQEANALGLRDRLREQDYSAYVDRIERDDQGPVYRLRVGPVVERDEAEALLTDLRSDADLDGLVVSHP